RQTIKHTRQLSHGLSPVPLEEDGLMSALRELAEFTTHGSNVPCDFLCPQPVRFADRIVATQLYRIAQEAVTNALRHSGASRITISLSQAGARLELRVEDDGQGLPEVPPTSTGIGLGTMNYRAGLICANLEVESVPGEGVCFCCTVFH